MNYRIWFKNYLRHPLQLGALFPSSSYLGSLMISHIGSDLNGKLLELGPGTGSFTRAMVDKGIPEEKLVLIEQSKDFVNLLRNSFPKANVVCGDVKELTGILNELGIHQFDEIVSGIPLNAMSVSLRKKICREAFNLLRPGGSFVQVSYLPRCSVPADVVKSYSAKKIYCGISLRNLPPAFVWRLELQ